jgi:hypothetical protein
VLSFPCTRLVKHAVGERKPQRTDLITCADNSDVYISSISVLTRCFCSFCSFLVDQNPIPLFAAFQDFPTTQNADVDPDKSIMENLRANTAMLGDEFRVAAAAAADEQLLQTISSSHSAVYTIS